MLLSNFFLASTWRGVSGLQLNCSREVTTDPDCDRRVSWGNVVVAVSILFRSLYAMRSRNSRRQTRLGMEARSGLFGFKASTLMFSSAAVHNGANRRVRVVEATKCGFILKCSAIEGFEGNAVHSRWMNTVSRLSRLWLVTTAHTHHKYLPARFTDFLFPLSRNKKIRVA